MDVPQSNIVKFYFEAANSIDIHNHYCQYLLRLEEIWQTKDWWVRIFQTVLGMIVVNSFWHSYFLVRMNPNQHSRNLLMHWL